VNPAASVSKVVLSISKIPHSIARDSTSTRVNELDRIETVPANTPRFNYYPINLAPLGLLIEQEVENKIAISNITQWTRMRVAVTASLSAFADPVYLIKENGTFLQNNIALPYPTVNYDTYRKLSIYMKNADNRFAQIAIGSDPNVFYNFDLEQGVLGTSANVVSSIIPVGDGWYRSSMTFSSPLGISFLI
jgi:hypothetical protein